MTVVFKYRTPLSSKDASFKLEGYASGNSVHDRQTEIELSMN